MSRVLVNGPASWNTLVAVEELPEARSHTVFARGHRRGLGGTSAGKALTLAALGVDVTLATVLGDDEPGALVRAALARRGLTLLTSPAPVTEQHLNLMADDGSRLSVYLELPAAPPAPAPGVLDALRTADAAVLDLAESSRPLLERARAAGVPVWCDVHDDDGSGSYPRAFVQAADVLVVSEDGPPDPRAYLRAAVDAGTALAVCTRGARGALALDADGWWEVDAAPATVVDTNGAGDAFVAGLLAATLAGRPRGEALRHAAAAGALAVSTPDLGAPDVTAADVAALAGRVRLRRP
ncbi:carbohydrate kinase family protein [Cellulomonas massiliensis]|uniref:carbohydrate kinase family protein n=1 Tax=Cellulomonas massiliensis TaxID=1465811 RepID=UPI0002FFF0D5|nr:carbohydrate kinase family protein [Cellulomonas massiliensis]